MYLLILRQREEKLLRKDKEIRICFIDLKKAFDRISEMTSRTTGNDDEP